ncbi:unnamed protein product [marine sediment metagenome]|uniref:Uncharacterized protein n=1 Tax=marine sediment metagenome TaxID=412755 RepID=X1SDD7_9ZZZZ
MVRQLLIGNRITRNLNNWDKGEALWRTQSSRESDNLSPGSAVGVGLADFVTRRLVSKIDYRVTYINCFTAMTPEKARLPAVGETDREAIEWAFQTIGAVEPQQARVVKIKNTLHLDELYISQPLVSELKAKPDWEVEQRAYEIRFDLEGNIYLA